MAIEIYKYDSDLPEEGYAAEITKGTIYLYATREQDGSVKVEPNFGFAEGTSEYRQEKALFEKYEKQLLESAERTLPETPSPSPAP